MYIEASQPKLGNCGNKFCSTQVFQRLLIVLFVATMVLPNSGCTSGFRIGSMGFGDALLESYRDRVWAKRAYNLRYNNCDIAYESHFQNGFVAGYCDTCNGGDGYVPALPPDEYRGFEYQSPDGAVCVKTWFEGFPAGVAAAKKDRAGEFHDIYTSRMINSAITQQNAKHILPGDVPVLSTNALGVAQRTGSHDPADKNDNLNDNIVGTQDYASSQHKSYVAPPTPSKGPLLNPQAPVIRKAGPSAMGAVSQMQQFTIDPSVKVQPPITSSTVTQIATVDDQALPPITMPTPKPTTYSVNSNQVSPTVPIVSTPRAEAVAKTYVQAQPVPVMEVKSQTPLPMAVRTANDTWRSQTSSRRR